MYVFCFRRLNTAPPAKPARTSIAQRINAFNQPQAAEPEPRKPSPTPGKVALSKFEDVGAVNNTQQQQSQQQHEPQKQQHQHAVHTSTQRSPSPATVTVHTSTLTPTQVAIAPVAAGVVAAAVAPALATNALEEEQPVKPEITAIANNDDVPSAADDYAAENEEQYSTIKRSPHSKSNSLQSPETSSSNATDTAVYQDQDDEGEELEEEVVRTKVSVTVQQPQSVKNGLSSALDRNDCKRLAFKLIAFALIWIHVLPCLQWLTWLTKMTSFVRSLWAMLGWKQELYTIIKQVCK